jgi:hypothetical protein
VKNWFKDPIAGATVVIAFATVINLMISVGLWIATKQSVDVARHVFQTANRPYIGTETIATNRNRQSKNLHIIASMKNYGTVPSEETELDWQVLLNGMDQPMTKIPVRPSVIMPGESVHFPGAIGPNQFDGIMNEQTVLQLILFGSYNGRLCTT